MPRCCRSRSMRRRSKRQRRGSSRGLTRRSPICGGRGGPIPKTAPTSDAFNPSAASNAIENGELPDTVRSFVFEGGTLGNTHFVAIPYNANAKAGAMVLADFLMSPEAQARKEDVKVWGDPTVLDVAALPEADRGRFAALDLGIATLPPEELGPVLPEPHPSWVKRIETEWAKRYGVLQ
jgi:putative thiamine transport system substrate-binding protein